MKISEKFKNFLTKYLKVGHLLGLLRRGLAKNCVLRFRANLSTFVREREFRNFRIERKRTVDRGPPFTRPTVVVGGRFCQIVGHTQKSYFVTIAFRIAALRNYVLLVKRELTVWMLRMRRNLRPFGRFWARSWSNCLNSQNRVVGRTYRRFLLIIFFLVDITDIIRTGQVLWFFGHVQRFSFSIDNFRKKFWRSLRSSLGQDWLWFLQDYIDFILIDTRV